MAVQLMARMLAAVVSATLVMGVAARADDWPQFRGPGQNCTSKEKIAEKWPEGGPKELWRIPIGEGFSQFVVVGDKAFVLAAREGQEALVCLDAATGKELWATPFDKTIKDGNGNGPRSTPAVDGDKVYAYGTYLKLACFNAADGKILWSHDINAEFAGQSKTPGINPWGASSSPIVDGDLVYIVGGGPGQSLMAFNKSSGEVAWKGEDDKLTHSTPVAATILDQRQIIFFTQKGLVSAEPATGKVLWRFAHPFKTSTAASPVVIGDMVYCSAAYQVGAAVCKISKEGDAFSATEVWRTPKENMNHWTTSVYYDGNIYGIFGHVAAKQNPLGCIDAKTGQSQWMEKGFGPGGLILAGDKLIVIGDQGQLVLAKATPAGYEAISRVQTIQDKKDKCWTMPTLANGKLYIRSMKEAICYEVGDGK